MLSCEFFPIEAVRTNLLGCDNVLDSAIRAGVKKVIVLSTDKAVYPTPILPFYRFNCPPALKFVTRHSVHSYLFPFHSGRRDSVFHFVEGVREVRSTNDERRSSGRPNGIRL